MSGIPLAPLMLLAQARIEAMPPVVQTVDVTEAVDSSPTFGLAAVALMALVIPFVAFVVVRLVMRRSNANWQMFREMCQAHELSRGQCRTLHRLSRQLRIANPNRLFLEAELWSPTLIRAIAGLIGTDFGKSPRCSALGRTPRSHFFVR